MNEWMAVDNLCRNCQVLTTRTEVDCTLSNDNTLSVGLHCHDTAWLLPSKKLRLHIPKNNWTVINTRANHWTNKVYSSWDKTWHSMKAKEAICGQWTKDPAEKKPMLCASGWSDLLGSGRREAATLASTSELGVICNYKSTIHHQLVTIFVSVWFILV